MGVHGEGRCQKIPALGDTKVPKRGRIDSYPTKEIYGWIWVFLGDLPEDERPEPPTLLPEYHQTDAWRTTRMVIEAPVNWTKFAETSQVGRTSCRERVWQEVSICEIDG